MKEACQRVVSSLDGFEDRDVPTLAQNPPRSKPRRDADPAAIASVRADAELELVAHVLALPAFGADVAGTAGIVPRDFDQPDARLMFCAADFGREHGLSKLDVLILARRALRADNLWDDTQVACNSLTSMRHSDDTLARLATCRPWCPASVRAAADALLNVIAYQRLAAASSEAA